MPSVGMEQTGIDYRECSYGRSRLRFRGPARPLDGPYTAVIGGSEAYGRFVEAPFPDLLEKVIGEPVVNLGVNQAGLTLLLDDPSIIEIASRARLTIIQALGAQNMSNRFYRVHPRRNDRFLAASDSLRALYPDVDFTDFHFTGHLLAALVDRDPRRFRKVEAELRTAWLSRMRQIINWVGGETVLLWISDRRPEEDATLDGLPPYLVDREMLEGLASEVAQIVEVVPGSAGDGAGLVGMQFDAEDREAALAHPNAEKHRQIAETLASIVSPVPARGIAPNSRPNTERQVVAR